jgi:hypothetical protein
MPGSFVDTSALAKHYHVEPGSAQVDRLWSDLGSHAVHFSGRRGRSNLRLGGESSWRSSFDLCLHRPPQALPKRRRAGTTEVSSDARSTFQGRRTAHPSDWEDISCNGPSTKPGAISRPVYGSIPTRSTTPPLCPITRKRVLSFTRKR